jgi:hypothetical protein
VAAVEWLCTELLGYGLIDWVPLLRVAELARRAGARRHSEVIAAGLAAIRRLLEAGLVEIGSVEAESGFHAWNAGTDEAVAMIRRAWQPKRWEDWGFFCWLAITEEGLRQAGELGGRPAPEALPE